MNDHLFHCAGCHSDVPEMAAHKRNCFAFSMKNGCEVLKCAKWRREHPDGRAGGVAGGAVTELRGVDVDEEAAGDDVDDDADVVVEVGDQQTVVAGEEGLKSRARSEISGRKRLDNVLIRGHRGTTGRLIVDDLEGFF